MITQLASIATVLSCLLEVNDIFLLMQFGIAVDIGEIVIIFKFSNILQDHSWISFCNFFRPFCKHANPFRVYI
jgi:hypothetical protein